MSAPVTGKQGTQWPTLLASLFIVFVLSVAVWWLTKVFPTFFSGTLRRTLNSIEFPVYAIALGLLANGLLTLLGWRERLAAAFRTELFLKTGVILLGAGLNLFDLLKIGLGGIIQAVILISSVFFTAWFLGGAFKLERHLRALIAASVSICGVSAAIAAAAAVQAKREQLGYVASLVIVFSLPLIFLQPLIAHWLQLSQAVAGAWIGGNIDTTAAVTASGAIAGQVALQYATVVKLSQNALIGLIAFLLTLYWITRVERDSGRERPRWSEIFTRFPKFVIGFILASLTMTVLLNLHWLQGSQAILNDLNALRTWFFTLAFVSIGLGFRLEGFKEAGLRPVLVYGLATLFNTALALLLAFLIFGVFAFHS
ncbi:MAG: putative sulfate exporter family transporter [Thermogemmatispora sp.]|nr:putative sulfate exporter family transporter [Thermogemmatispora sp.]